MNNTKKINWWRTDFGEKEIEKVTASIADEHISQGPVTEEFERTVAQKLEVPYVVATTSGSIAMLMSLLAAGVEPEDEVIVPNRTWIATAHAPLLLGAKVVFVDVEPNRPIIDASKIETKVTKKTKVIMPVHLNGRSADMEAINKIAQDHGLIVIEDAAQAFCSRNKNGFLGTQSFAGCFSLSVAKIISTGQGGFVVTREENIYKRLISVRTHGVGDVINVQYSQKGFNFRFNDILASMGVIQVGRVDERIEYVKLIYAKYAGAIASLPFLKLIPVNVSAGEIPIYVEVLCPEREKLMAFLQSNSIQTRPFYPDLDSAGYFKVNGEFANSRPYGKQGLFLPSGPSQPLENIDYVIEVLKKFK